MTLRNNFIAAFLTFLLCLLSLAAVFPFLRSPFARLPGAETFVSARQPLIQPEPERYAERVARRLQRRLQNGYGRHISLSILTSAVEMEQSLFRSSVSVQMRFPDREMPEEWIVSLHEYPLWLRPELTASSFRFVLDEERITSTLQTRIEQPVSAVLHSVTHAGDQETSRAVVEGIARSGYSFPSDASRQLKKALEHRTPSLAFFLVPVAGTIVNASGEDLGELTLLATGRSDFAGSGDGRKSNVRLGLKNLNNALVYPGDVFSFVDAIGPISASRGWKEALGIFNGSELRMIIGGGMCQVATTLYRSVLNAGLPILQRKNHSLFVHYYEKFGLGLDATVFPGTLDFLFRNDTAHPILVQTYTVGDEAFVHFYGTKDGRSVALAGPYVSGSEGAPMIKDQPLRRNQIAWMQTIRSADGTTKEHLVLSTYNSIPRKVIEDQLALEKQDDIVAQAVGIVE